MIASTGWTWDYIADNMDIPRLMELKKYWAKNPPLHMMVKGYLGLGKEEQPQEEGNLADIMAMAPQTPGSAM